MFVLHIVNLVTHSELQLTSLAVSTSAACSHDVGGTYSIIAAHIPAAETNTALYVAMHHNVLQPAI